MQNRVTVIEPGVD